MQSKRAQTLLDEIQSKVAITATVEERNLLSRLQLITPRGDVYCTVTDEGIRINRALKAALSRLEGVVLETFLDERNQLWSQIRERLEKRNAALAYLKSVGFSDNREVRQFALSVAALPATPKEVWERAKIISDHLYSKEWGSSKRLRIVSTVMRHDGNIEQLREELVETFLMMVNDGHNKSYGTWWEAANVMRFPGQTPQERYARFEALQQELGKRQWKARSAATGYIAVYLGRRDGTPVELAEQFRELEKAIIATGRKDCVKSGIAAVILLNVPGSNSEKAERFTATFEAIHKLGWRKNTDRYPVAAVLAIMPGTVEENALLLLETCEFINGGSMGSSDYHLTDLALALLGSGYQAMTQSRHTSYSHSYHGSSYDYDSGFSLTGAVIGGVITGGSLVGILLGGVLWDDKSDEDDNGYYKKYNPHYDRYGNYHY